MPLKIEGLGEIKEIEECEITHRAYQHSVCRFVVGVKKDDVTNYFAKTDTQITVTDDGESGSIPLFRGFVTELDITEGRDGYLSVTAFSYSAKADVKRNNRVFQCTDKKLSDIAKLTADDSKKGGVAVSVHTDNLKDDMQFEEPVVQYQETDFEFLKRLAVTSKCALFPENSAEPSFFIGTKIGSASDSVDINENGTVSRVHNKWVYDYAREQFILILTVTSSKFYEFGKELSYNGKKYVVFGWNYNYRNRADQYSYEICEEGKIPCDKVPVPPQRVYLEAEVENIADDENLGRIEVSFEKSGFKELGSGKKFKIPFRTPYTAGDRGIVFLPEEHDIVEVVFSSGTFFAGSVMRRKALDKEVSTVEKQKHIMVYDNRITFTEDEIEIRRRHGSEHNLIKIDDDTILLEIGDSKIEMKKDKITLSVSGSKIEVDSDNIKIKGSGGINIESSKIVMKK